MLYMQSAFGAIHTGDGNFDDLHFGHLATPFEQELLRRFTGYHTAILVYDNCHSFTHHICCAQDQDGIHFRLFLQPVTLLRESDTDMFPTWLAALSEGDNPLTRREREVLTIALSGVCIAEIAEQKGWL